ncbi:MAG: sugar phosphate isomerase/epimerase, partial [Gordonia sp. (in: high G+C Gram-positive bacteria)]
ALLSRGLMGDGVIDFGSITRTVSDTGYSGDIEVEIFNEAVWETPGDQVIAAIVARYGELVLPHLQPVGV